MGEGGIKRKRDREKDREGVKWHCKHTMIARSVPCDVNEKEREIYRK